MLGVRKTDPRFVNFVPRTAEEAVDRYIRCRRNGLKAYLVPECLIDCAKALEPEEMSKFENWIVNPQRDLTKLDLVEQKAIRSSNDAVFASNEKRIEAQLDSLPPVPMEAQHAVQTVDDEKMPPMQELTLEPEPDMGTPSNR